MTIYASPEQVCGIEVTCGTWTTGILNGGSMAMVKSFVAIDGTEHELAFATPLLIPVAPGRHIVEVYQLQKLALTSWAKKRQNAFSLEVDVAPNIVKTFLYRQHHTTFGPLFNKLKNMTFKEGDPRPLAVGAFQYGAPYQSYDSRNQQAHSQPHYQQAAPQPHYQHTPQPEPEHFASPFTDSSPQQVATPRAAASTKTRFCTQCGTEVTTGHRFCGGCGQAV